MKPKRAQYRAIHKIADRVEPRLARAMRGYADRVRARLPLEAIAQVIANGNPNGLDGLLVDLEDAALPTVGIVRDAFEAGAKETRKELA